MNVDIDDELTLNMLMDGAKGELGSKRFLNYNASSSNCQDFIRACILSNGLLNSQRNEFIKQDTTDVFKDGDALRKFSNFIVNELASRASILFNGGCIEDGDTKKTRKVSKWIIHLKLYRSKHPNL
jgi:hypothetical protein